MATRTDEDYPKGWVKKGQLIQILTGQQLILKFIVAELVINSLAVHNSAKKSLAEETLIVCANAAPGSKCAIGFKFVTNSFKVFGTVG